MGHAAAALLVAWGVATPRSTVHADATGTDADPLGTTPWLVLALVAAVLCVLVPRRDARRSRSR